MFFKDKKSLDRVSVVDDTSTNLFNTMESMVHCYWWDETLNFGDWIGPWLISMKSGKPVLNTRKLNTSTPTIFSVGSILHQLAFVKSKPIIWGSGLIKPIDLRKKIQLRNKVKYAKFVAVRGKLTHHELTTKLGIDIPEVYGDPALLLARYYTVKKLEVPKIALCPHHIHYHSLKDKFENFKDINVIDVKQDPRTIIDQIANADICISSSLHGLIIAQTYNVPWVWLRLEDHKLVGDSFKFFDFYSTLVDCNKTHQASCCLNKLSYELLMNYSKQAQTFELAIDLDVLDNAINSYIK